MEIKERYDLMTKKTSAHFSQVNIVDTYNNNFVIESQSYDKDISMNWRGLIPIVIEMRSICDCMNRDRNIYLEYLKEFVTSSS